MGFQVFHCRLLVEHGPMISFGELAYLVRIDALGVTHSAWYEPIRVRTVERSPAGALSERKLTPPLSEVSTLVDLLRGVQFPGRVPQLESISDTSDSWERITLLVSLDDTSQTLQLDMQSSGFRGPDANTWQKVFERILALGGVSGYHART